MAADNNTTITFLLPLPASAAAVLQSIVAANLFALDWDDKAADLSKLGTGVISLVARDCAFDVRQAIMNLAKESGFSVIIHCEDNGDYEGECKSDLVAFERGTGREIAFMATNNSHEPLLSLREVFPFDAARLKRELLLPVDILEAEGERMAAWCKRLMEAA